MNVLDVNFDAKLNWNQHIANTVSKAKRSLFALRLLKKYLTTPEMRLLCDSHFYSVLYYNLSIWLTPGISHDMKQNLLSISANALRTCLRHYGHDVSFESLHKIHEKSTQSKL